MVEPATEVQADQLPSFGVVVLPVRVWKVSEVPVGRLLIGFKLSHCTVAPASNTRETKTPVAALGLMWIQSMGKVGPPARSLPTGRMFAVMAMACDATCAPSIEKTVPVLVQSIR